MSIIIIIMIAIILIKIQRICQGPFPPEGGSKRLITMTDYKYGGGGEWMTELQVMRKCTMHDDENVNRAVAGYICINEVTLEKVCFKSLSE